MILSAAQRTTKKIRLHNDCPGCEHIRGRAIDEGFMIFHLLADPDYWFKKRDGYLIAARECKHFLTTDREYNYPEFVQKNYTIPASRRIEKAKYQLGAPEVHEAVRHWVHRARQAHAIAMGRRPVMDNLISITNDGAYQAALMVKKR